MSMQVQLIQERAARSDGYVLASKVQISPQVIASTQTRNDISRCFLIKRLNENSFQTAREVFERVLEPTELGDFDYNPLDRLVFESAHGLTPLESITLVSYPDSWAATFVLAPISDVNIIGASGKTVTVDNVSALTVGDFLRIDDPENKGVFRITGIAGGDITLLLPENLEEPPVDYSFRRFNTAFTTPEGDATSIQLNRRLPSLSPHTKVSLDGVDPRAIPARQSATAQLFRDDQFFQYFTNPAAVVHAQDAQQKYMQEYVKKLNYVIGEYGTFDLITTTF